MIGTVALGANVALGEVGLVLAIVGILFAVGGAAIDTAFSGAYNIAQFLGWEWGKYRAKRTPPASRSPGGGVRSWRYVIVSTGVDPVQLTEYSVVLLRRRPAADLSAGAAGRPRPLVHGRARERPRRQLLRLGLPGGDRRRRVAAIPLLIATNAGGG